MSESKKYNFLIPVIDTDSLSICKQDLSSFSDKEILSLTEELNSIMEEQIRWEFEMYAPKILVIKSKNYVFQDEKNKITIKGSSIKDTKKEPKLLNFMKDIIDSIMNERGHDDILRIYNDYVKACFNIKDINPWCKKVTITEKVLNPKRSNEQNVLDALGDMPVQEGDKVFLFYMKDGSLCLREKFKGEYDEMKLVKRLYDTLDIFSNVLDISQYPNYTLKRNKILLEELLSEEGSEHSGVSDSSESDSGHPEATRQPKKIPKFLKSMASVQGR